MRMWMINPKVLCRQHLLGEHNEVHKLVGCLLKNRSIKGYLNRGFLEPQNVFSRHAQLVEEMLRRGHKHESPLNIKDCITSYFCKVDRNKSVKDLIARCEECKERIYNVYRTQVSLL